MAMSWRPKTASAFATWGLARRVVNVLSTYPGATLTKMTLVPNSSLGIQNTSSLLRMPSHLRVPTTRDPDRPHVVDSRPRIDQTWLITVWSGHMENLRASTIPSCPAKLGAQGPSNTTVLQSNVETNSLKLTKNQARLLEKTAPAEGLPAKSEFVRYALARALEDRLSVETIEEIFEARRQVRTGKTVPWRRLKAEG